MSRRITLAAVVCAAASATLIATPAHASAREEAAAPSPAAAVTAERVKCTDLSSGQLCISLGAGPQNIAVFYTKKSGAAIKAHLGFRSSKGTSWGVKKTISKNERANSTWNMSYPCGKFVGLIKVDGQGTFETPAASC